jgi:hypothetical protein
MQNDGMMSIDASHPKIQELLHPYIASDSRSERIARCAKDQLLLLDERLVDFGCRYRITVQKAESKDDHTDIMICVHVGIVGWDKVKDQAIPALQSIFGVDAILCIDRGHHSGADTQTQDVICQEYNVSIQVCSQKNPNLTQYISSLCKVRSIILGSGLMSAFRSLLDTTEMASSVPKQKDSASFQIPIQRCYKTTQSMVVTTTQSERVTIVIPVAFQDGTDRALAKLFLQQFQQAQRRSSAKNVPLCDFRRCNEPPREMEPYLDELPSSSVGGEHLAGYISFTFFENHIKSEENVERMAQNLLMFFDFVDYHVKCSKSYIHSRMREKKDVLLMRLRQN